MDSIVTVTTAATATDFTTVARVKAELDITDDSGDALLADKIKEASSMAEAFLGYTVPRETVSEAFRPERSPVCVEYLVLDRVPVVSIASVTLDGDVVDSDEYEVDAKTGLLYRLDASGYRMSWEFCKSAIVAYTGGDLMPGQTGRTLESAIEAGVIDLVRAYWFGRGRDPLLRSVDIPGVQSETYWVPGMGEAGQLPPSVVTKLEPFRRIRV